MKLLKQYDTELLILAAWVLLFWLSAEAGVTEQAVDHVRSAAAGWFSW